MTKALPELDPTELDRPLPERQTIIDRDRRRKRRVRLEFETAVPVLVRTQRGSQRGLVRNVSDEGMLIELPLAPGIGSIVEVCIGGQAGAEMTPEPVSLWAEVRHQINWNFRENEERRSLQAIGLRFVRSPEPSVPPGVPIH